MKTSRYTMPRSGRSLRFSFLPIFSLLVLLKFSHALEFDLLYQTKCIMEEVNDNVLALIEYTAFKKTNESELVPISLKVEDPDGRLLNEIKNQGAGQYGFTTKAAGEHRACFSVADVTQAQNTRVRVDWKVGVAATDWDSLAKRENLNAMATELRRLEETVREIHDEMIQMRKREEEMRDLNEATNSRIAAFSTISMLVCVAVGVWQLFYLRSFLIRKKVL